MRQAQHSPTSKFITTTRLVGSPPSVREQRTDSINSRVTKVTTYRHPKTTITTYRPVIETRTVRLCTDTKCQGHEALIEQLTQENARLNQRLMEMQGEYENSSYKQRTESTSWHIEIENMRRLYEESQSNHQDEVQYLNGELTACRQRSEEYYNETIALRQKYENQVCLLSQEIERLNQQMYEKNGAADQWILKFRDLEGELRVRNEILDERSSELSKVRKQYQESCNQLVLIRAELDRQYETIQQLECKFSNQGQHWQYIIDQKDSAITQLRQNIHLVEMRSEEHQATIQGQHKEIENLQIRLDTMSQQVEYFQGECSELTSQKSRLQSEYDQAQNEISALQEQLYKLKIANQEANLLTEKRKLEFNSQIGSLKQEFQAQSNDLFQSKKKIEELEFNLTTITNIKIQFQKQLDEKVNEALQFKTQLQQLTGDYNLASSKQSDEIHRLKLSIEDYLLNIQQLQSRKQHLESLTQERSTEIQRLQEQIRFLQQELLNASCRQSEETHSLKQQLEDFEVNQTQLENANTQLKKSEDQLTKELNVLKYAHSETVADLEKRIAALESALATARSEQQRQQQWIVELEQKIKEQEGKIKEQESKIRQYEEKLSLLSSEIQRMLYQLNQKNDLIQEQALALDEYAAKLKNVEQLWKSDALNYQEVQADLEAQINELQGLHREKALALEGDLLKHKNMLDEQDHVIRTLSQQLEGTQKELRYKCSLEDELNKKTQFLQSQLSSLQKSESDLRFASDQQSIQLKVLHQQLNDKNAVEGELRFRVEKLSEELRIKQAQLEELENQLKELELQTQSETVLVEEKITHYVNEVETWKQKFITLNRDYHRTQEDLMMLQAEFDAFKQRKNVVEISRSVKESSCFEVRKSSLYVSKENQDGRGSTVSIVRALKEANI